MTQVRPTHIIYDCGVVTNEWDATVIHQDEGLCESRHVISWNKVEVAASMATSWPHMLKDLLRERFREIWKSSIERKYLAYANFSYHECGLRRCPVSYADNLTGLHSRFK